MELLFVSVKPLERKALGCKELIHFRPRMAFTLAEVLIALAIIGIVAIMTIPTVISKIQNKQHEIALKKLYSELSQITVQLVYENGGSLKGLFTDDSIPLQVFKEKIKNAKVCQNSTTSGRCWPKDWYSLNGTKISSTENKFDALITRGGATLLFGLINSNCSSSSELTDAIGCARIRTDINGLKKPNTVGRDIFDFYLTEDKLIPRGAPETTASITSGWGKAYYVLHYGMDY